VTKCARGHLRSARARRSIDWTTSLRPQKRKRELRPLRIRQRTSDRLGTLTPAASVHNHLERTLRLRHRWATQWSSSRSYCQCGTTTDANSNAPSIRSFIGSWFCASVGWPLTRARLHMAYGHRKAPPSEMTWSLWRWWSNDSIGLGGRNTASL